jgi:hypothetical protein
VVDAAYLARTGDQLPVGGLLPVTSDDFEHSLEIVRDASAEMLRAASELRG